MLVAKTGNDDIYQEFVLKYSSKGIPLYKIAKLLEITESELNEMIERWNEETGFEILLKNRRAEAILSNINLISNAASNDWKAAKYLLEQSAPDVFVSSDITRLSNQELVSRALELIGVDGLVKLKGLASFGAIEAEYTVSEVKEEKDEK